MRKSIIPILVALMTISCTIPTVPQLPVPEKPIYPKLSQTELALLNKCSKGKNDCLITWDILAKLAHKDVMCRNYAKELLSVIESTK